MKLFTRTLIGIFLISCTSAAQARTDEILYGHWIHLESSKNSVDIVYPTNTENGLFMFIVDPENQCDASLVYSNSTFNSHDLKKLNNSSIDWEIAGQKFLDKYAGTIKTQGYVRIELTHFYKNHFNQIEDFLAPNGVIDFRFYQTNAVSFNMDLTEFEWNVDGLSDALNSALDHCNGRY